MDSASSLTRLLSSLSYHQQDSSLRAYFRDRHQLLQLERGRGVSGWVAVLKVGKQQVMKASGKSQAEAEMRVVRSLWGKVIEESKEEERNQLHLALIRAQQTSHPSLSRTSSQADLLIEATLRAKELHQSLLSQPRLAPKRHTHPGIFSAYSLISPKSSSLVGFKSGQQKVEDGAAYRSLAEARLEAKLKKDSKSVN